MHVEDHHHFYFEEAGRLEDIPADRLSIQRIPRPPEGTRIARVDVVIRLQDVDS